MTDAVLTTKTAITSIVLASGGKCVTCRDKSDYHPQTKSGRNHIDYITEEGNVNYGLKEDGTVIDMSMPNAFETAADDPVLLVMIFSVPKNAFPIDACFQTSGAHT